MAEMVDKRVEQPGTLGLVVSRNLDTATHLLGYAHRCVRRLDIELSKDAATEIAFSNGSRIKSLAATKSAGRGFDANDVVIDEHAHQQWQEEIYESISPTVSRGGTITSLSTPKGRRNLFYRIFAGLEGGGWSHHTIPWHCCPVYDSEWEADTRRRMTKRAFAQEYDCSFEESGMARFSTEDIERSHDGWAGYQDPRPNRRYLNAWDIGRHHDYTVGGTFDCTEEPYQLVAFERFTGLPYPKIQKKIEERDLEYVGETWVDSTGAGDPVLENLAVRARGFVFTHRSKLQALDALSIALENGTLKLPRIREIDEELIGYEDDDKDIVQDIVMMLAIGTLKAAPRWVLA